MNRNWLMSAIALLGLCGCAPIQVTCKVPAPPEPLMEPAPAPGSFQDRLDAILDGISTTSPAKPTK
jgi:hypothetical protein